MIDSASPSKRQSERTSCSYTSSLLNGEEDLLVDRAPRLWLLQGMRRVLHSLQSQVSLKTAIHIYMQILYLGFPREDGIKKEETYRPCSLTSVKLR